MIKNFIIILWLFDMKITVTILYYIIYYIILLLYYAFLIKIYIYDYNM